MDILGNAEVVELSCELDAAVEVCDAADVLGKGVLLAEVGLVALRFESLAQLDCEIFCASCLFGGEQVQLGAEDSVD